MPNYSLLLPVERSRKNGPAKKRRRRLRAEPVQRWALRSKNISMTAATDRGNQDTAWRKPASMHIATGWTSLSNSHRMLTLMKLILIL